MVFLETMGKNHACSPPSHRRQVGKSASQDVDAKWRRGRSRPVVYERSDHHSRRIASLWAQLEHPAATAAAPEVEEEEEDGKTNPLFSDEKIIYAEAPAEPEERQEEASKLAHLDELLEVQLRRHPRQTNQVAAATPDPCPGSDHLEDSVQLEQVMEGDDAQLPRRRSRFASGVVDGFDGEEENRRQGPRHP